MDYEEDILRKVTQAGTLGYPLSKIKNIIEVEDNTQFKKDFYDKNSCVFSAYQKGVDISDFILDGKLFEMAKSGDIKALEKYEERKRQNQIKYIQEKL